MQSLAAGIQSVTLSGVILQLLVGDGGGVCGRRSSLGLDDRICLSRPDIALATTLALTQLQLSTTHHPIELRPTTSVWS